MRFSLVIIIFFALCFQSFAQNTADNDADLKWANDLSNSAQNMVWEDLLKKFNEQEQLEGKEEYTLHPTSKLYVFVSSSMPVPLLKEYASDAMKYDATLVFKGLPNGSFKELAELMTELKAEHHDSDKDNIANATIDDESFDRFGVSSVSSIVLTEEPPYQPNQTPHIKFDKITGNVGIKYALEQFETSGELQKEAAKRLGRFKND